MVGSKAATSAGGQQAALAVSDEEAYEAFSRAFPEFDALRRFYESMRGMDRYFRRDIRRYKKDPQSFDFDETSYEYHFETINMEYEVLQEAISEIPTLQHLFNKRPVRPEYNPEVVQVLGSQHRRIRQRGAERVLLAEDYEKMPSDLSEWTGDYEDFNECVEASQPQDYRLAELFDVLNAKYFEGVLPSIPILRGMPYDASGGLNGLTRMRLPKSGDIPTKNLRIKIYLSDRLFTSAMTWDEIDRWDQIANTLLHEMAHLAVHLDALGNEEPFDQEHGQRFTDECNRIGLHLGGPQVKPFEEAGTCNCECGSDLWPNSFLEEKYGSVLSLWAIEKFATPQRAAA